MNKPTAIILMGLPLSGKSTWIENELNIINYVANVVSADEIKKSHIDYDPNNTEPLHQWSVIEARKEIEKISDLNEHIIFDSGSINNSYTINIIKMLKNKGYYIQLVHVNTPYIICLERNKLRERKIPENAIISKATKEKSQFHKLSKLVDVVQVVDYFTNKHIFVDMDGVIAALSTLPIVNGEIDFVNNEIYRFLPPVKQVIDKLWDLKKKGYKLYILSAIPNSISFHEKNEWLDREFNIDKKHRFFVNQGKHKAEMLENLATHLKIDKKDVLMIDDIHDTLYKVQARKMNCMHVSEFLTHNFN